MATRDHERAILGVLRVGCVLQLWNLSHDVSCCRVPISYLNVVEY